MANGIIWEPANLSLFWTGRGLPLKRTDDPLSLRLGVDGIYIKKGHASGCFLPQVADETGWSKEEFLSYCCAHKAGLAEDTWKDPKTEVYLFTADAFEADFKDI
jgi:uncharacterized protein (TIGR00296 family)